MRRRDPILDEINHRVKIEDLVEESGIPLDRRAGRYLRPKARGHGVHSLIIDTENNSYHYNGNSEHGDIFSWKMNREGWDFKEALGWLANRAGVPLPEKGGNSEQMMSARIAQRTREDVFKVAAGVFEAWLWKSDQALAYVRGRGLHDESIRRVTAVENDGIVIKSKGAGLGFSGTATAAEFDEMRQSFISAGIDPECPAAIAVLGLQGGAEKITAWCGRFHVEAAGAWLTKGYINGLMSKRFPKIIFPHWSGGAVDYLSTRVLAWQDDGSLKNANEPKSLDPWRELAGSPTPYFGFAYRRDSMEIIAQEGQFDVLSASQWGLSAVGLKGTSWQDKAEELKGLSERHRAFYIATDSDKAGQKVVTGEKEDYPLLNVTGPMTRWLRGWLKKDANDLLQWFLKRGIEHDRQIELVRTLLDERAEPLIMALAKEAGSYKKSSPRRAMLMDLIVPALNRMSDSQLTDYRMELAAALYPANNYPKESQKALQQFNKLLKDGKDKKGDDDDSKPGEIVETLGGWFPVSDDGEKGFFVEVMYDIRTRKGGLAYRDPDGNIGTANYLDINGMRLVPAIDENMQTFDQNDLPVVLMPSALGEKKSMKELSFIIETFMRRYFLLDDPVDYELISLYPFLTWNYELFGEIPYMRARGKSGSGKSELMTRLGLLCYRMMISTGVNTIATMKYMCHIYRGTLFVDECDKFARDEFDERNILLRVGFSKMYGKITAMMEAQVGGVRTFKPMSTRVFGPKLLTMYKEFADEGNENRCVTFELKEKEVQELINRHIPTNDPRDVRKMWDEAQVIRNLMLRWKLETYKRYVDINDGLQLRDTKVSNRVNQIAMPLKILAQNDPEMLKKIDRFMQRSYYKEVNKRAEKPEARVLDALVEIVEKDEYSKYMFEGRVPGMGIQKYAFYKDIAMLANQAMDRMNAREDETEEEQKRRKRKALSPNGIGFICRDDLGMETSRVGTGSIVILNEERIGILKTKYGVEEANGAEEKAISEDEAHYAEQAEMFDE